MVTHSATRPIQPSSDEETDSEGTNETKEGPGGAADGVPGDIHDDSRDGGGTSGPPLATARAVDLTAVRARVAEVLVYPPLARRQGLAGQVVLVFTLRTDGSIHGLRVEHSSGIASLDEAALTAVRRGAPFPPPDIERLLALPVTFRITS